MYYKLQQTLQSLGGDDDSLLQINDTGLLLCSCITSEP